MLNVTNYGVVDSMSNDKETKDLVLNLDNMNQVDISLESINLAACSPYFYSKLKEQHPKDIHKKMILNLTHESLSEKKALVIWNEIVKHMRSLNEQLQRSVGIAVASMDYLTNINTTVSNPILIDEQFSSEVILNSTKDPLTSVYNRDFFDSALNHQLNLWRRNSNPLCLMMLDIDDFKLINDMHGHQQGDHVLKNIASIIKSHVRDADIVTRYGGEEFAVIMPSCCISDAEKVAERVRQNVSKNPLIKDQIITVSIGLVEASSISSNIKNLIHHCDISLYVAKEKGKNQVASYDA